MLSESVADAKKKENTNAIYNHRSRRNRRSCGIFYDKGRKRCDTDCPWPSSGSYERAWIGSGASLGSESGDNCCESNGYGTLQGTTGCDPGVCKRVFTGRYRPVYPPRGKTGYDCDSDSEYLWNRCKTAKRTAGTSGDRRMHLCICQHQRTGCVSAAWEDSADRLWSSGKDRLETGTRRDPSGFCGQCHRWDII